MHEFRSDHPFPLENGVILPGIGIAYMTYGRLNKSGDNVIWICHALTANAEVDRWWPGIVGKGKSLDPDKYFIVCANILGSCYGSTGPLSVDPLQGNPYYSRFPMITIRDMVQAHILLRKHLGIEQIRLLMGGSMGGYQAMEWCLMEPGLINDLFLIATSASESPWGIAIHTAQRLAIEADPGWKDARSDAGAKGLKAARAIGILSYRNYSIISEKQADPDHDKLDGFISSSYINYQGDKLAERFNAFSYWILTKAMDSHNVARGRGGDLKKTLAQIAQRTLVIGISSDILCPLTEQRLLADHIPAASLLEMDSAYGHDGFMVEYDKISQALKGWMKQD